MKDTRKKKKGRKRKNDVGRKNLEVNSRREEEQRRGIPKGRGIYKRIYEKKERKNILKNNNKLCSQGEIEWTEFMKILARVGRLCE